MSDDRGRHFGDDEPEDAWDPDDPLPDLIHNLERRVHLLERFSLRDRLDELEQARARIEQLDLDDRERLRLRQLIEDLAFLRDRLDREGE